MESFCKSSSTRRSFFSSSETSMTYHMASFDKSLSQNSYGPISTQNESADSDGAVLFSQPDAYDQKDYYLHVFSSDRFNFDLTPPASSVYYCNRVRDRMKRRLRALLHSRRSQTDAVGSHAKGMKGVTCNTSAS
jgi:hypothetical protein